MAIRLHGQINAKATTIIWQLIWRWQDHDISVHPLPGAFLALERKQAGR
jgi:hypothetical protein